MSPSFGRPQSSPEATGYGRRDTEHSGALHRHARRVQLQSGLTGAALKIEASGRTLLFGRLSIKGRI
jgi:hypothetical protein